MGDNSSDSIPPELRVVLDLEVTLQGAITATDHQKLLDALNRVPGIASVNLWEDKLSVRYEPEKITQHRLHELIVAEGFTIAGEDSARPAPSVDGR